MQDMRKVTMIAVMITESTMIMTIMTHKIIVATMMIVKLIAIGSTQRKQNLCDINNNKTLIHF